MNKLLSLVGAALGHFVKAFIIGLGFSYAVWWSLEPEFVGHWLAEVNISCLNMEALSAKVQSK